PTLAIAVLAVPLFDTLRVFSHRLMRGVSPFTPDRNHVHHLIIDNGNSHGRATLYLSIASALIVLFSLFAAQSSMASSLSVVVLVFAVYAMAVRRSLLVRRSKLFVQKREPAKTRTISEVPRETTPTPTLQPQTAQATSISV
ncbi:MAG: hypothetical protein AAF223_11025, partial [Bacteroidota bacterium]